MVLFQAVDSTTLNDRSS